MGAIDYLIEWAGNTNWKKHFLNEVLKESEINIETLKNEIIDIHKKNNEIQLVFQKPSSLKADYPLIINSIRTPININAISEDSEFFLGKNLNVLYGENGTGKSSYVKLFRKLSSNYFTSQKKLDLHPNVYKEHSSKIDQTIEITFETHKKEIENLNINKPNEVLRNINVFDSDSIIPLINQDLTFSILPQGFNHFHTAISLLDSLKLQLDGDIMMNHRQKEAIFKDSSFDLIKSEIAAIQKEATLHNFLAYIKTNFPTNKNDNQELESIERQIKEITSTNKETSIKLLAAQKK